MKSDRSDLSTLLERFGAPRDGVVALDAPSGPEQIRYLDLLRSALPDDARPAAVVELRGRPVLFVARGDRPLNLPPLRRALALRADGAFLGIVEPGRLMVRTIELDPKSEREILVASADDPKAATVIPELALRPPKTTEQVSAVHNLLFDLLDSATTTMAHAGLPADDALSLAGRALFLRFLVDRNVIGAGDVHHVCKDARSFEQCFETTENIAATSQWLDRTFNGDLLPLTAAVDGGDGQWMPRLSMAARKRVSNALTLIMHRAEPSGQLRLDWGDLDFAHVPIGLLSQVYERHSQRYYGGTAKETSVYYTPRSIAEYMVDEAFAAMDEPHAARVLDPAVGGGVFLVSAFRRLVEARWRHDGKRPTTRTIRQILNQQLAGFEINEAALRLTALSLYLTALELDPHPHPITELRFQNLRGSVLADVRSTGNATYELGSLGPAVGREHNGAYDLVIGNPPWTALKRQESFRSAVLQGIRPIVRERLGEARAATFTLPDDVPDLAFLWQSLRWAKPSGHLAFAVHGRLLFKQAPAGRQARADLFEAVRITGILNGAALRQTDVWPDVDAPFALIFGRNESPAADSAFYFVSPDREDSLNRRGTVRIDPNAATIVQQREAIRTSHLLKTLFRGTTLDLAVIEKIDTHAPLALEEYWESLGLQKSGQGFRVGGSTQQSAAILHGLPQLTKVEFNSYRVRPETLPRFTKSKLHRPRRREIYRAPLVIVPKTPSPERTVPRAAIAFEDVAFNESFYSYSAAGHNNPELLARYLLLVLNSDLPIYLALLTSGQFGTERDALYKEDLESLPIPPLADLTTAQISQVRKLSATILADKAQWDEITDFVAQLYGLNRWDREVMRDTLAVAAPFAGARRRAQQRPTEGAITAFAKRLAHDLRPFLDAEINVRRTATDRSVPWVWLALGAIDPDLEARPLARAATDLAATQIIACTSNGGVAVGIIDEQRYWTPTRARLLALHLLHDDEISKRISGHAAE